MTSRSYLLSALVAVLCFAAIMLWSGTTRLSGSESGKRAFSYAVAAPKGWPIIHDTRFNSDKIEPDTFRTDYWIDDISLGGGHISGSIQRDGAKENRVTISARWIEWKTGKAFRASLVQEVDPDWGTVILRFQRDGALSLYRRSDALLAGSLGRQATQQDFVELVRTCGEPLAESADLEQARADNHMLDLATFDPSAFPDAPPSFCSE